VEGIEAAPCSAAPALNFKLRLENLPAEETIESVMLQCQIRIDAARRRYSGTEQQSLHDLFGEPADWSRTLRGMLWTHSHAAVPAFEGSVVVDLPVACTFDLTVASAKYFHGLEDGSVPVTLLFSGTVFFDAGDGALQVAQIPWSKEVSSEVPVHVWKEMIDRYYPNTAWLCLRRDVFDRLHRYKIERGLPTWEQTLESILP
jgi:Family of unknown function (DUF6084)